MVRLCRFAVAVVLLFTAIVDAVYNSESISPGIVSRNTFEEWIYPHMLASEEHWFETSGEGSGTTDGSGSTPEPTTPEPTTPEPTTPEPITTEPTTPEPTTPEPITTEPTTPEPTTPEPTTPEPTTPEPTIPEPTSQEPTTPESTTPEPTIPEPTTKEPITPERTTPEPTIPEPTTKEPTTITTTTATTTTTTIATTTATQADPDCSQTCIGCDGPCTLDPGIGGCNCSCIDGFEPIPGGCKEVLCPEDTIPYQNNLTVNVTFPSTQTGYTTSSITTCPEDVGKPYGTRACNLNGAWDDPTWLSSCGVSIENLVNTTISEENRQEVANDLKVITSDPEELGEENIAEVVEVLEEVVDAPTLSPETSSSVVATVGNLLEASDEALESSDQTEEILGTLDAVGEKVELEEGEEYQEVTSTVAIAVVEPTPEADWNRVGYGVRALSTSREEGFRSDQLQSFNGDADGNFSSYITVPYTESTLRTGNFRTSFYAFSDDRLFQSSKNSSLKFTSTVVLAATVVGESSFTTGPGEPVVIKLSLQKLVNQSNPYLRENTLCSYWHNDSWSQAGMRLVELTQDSVTCESDHLTNFAALFNPNYAQTWALDIISIVGCFVSIIFLSALLALIFVNKGRGRMSRGSFLLGSLAVSLLCLDICMILSEAEFIVRSPEGCVVIAVFIHYFLLTSLCWMTVEAVTAYIATSFPFYMRALSSMRIYISSSLFSWLLPAVFVAVLLAVDLSYYERQDDTCWIADDYILYFSGIPFAVIIVVNMGLYIAVMHAAFTSRKLNTRTVANRSRYRKNALLSLSFFVCMGGTWLFALILVFDTSGGTGATVFAYLFAIFNSLQGLLLFILYFIREKIFQRKLNSLASDTFRMDFNRSELRPEYNKND